MENQQTSSKQIMLNYGLILGIVSIFISVLNYAFGNIYKPHWVISTLSAVISIAFIVMGLKAVKALNGGFLTLGQSLKTGLGIALISGLITVVYLFIFTSYIEPNFYENLFKFTEQGIIEKSPNMSEEQLEMTLEMTKKFMGPGITSAFTLGGSLFFGFIISLIAGLIMKKSAEE